MQNHSVKSSIPLIASYNNLSAAVSWRSRFAEIIDTAMYWSLRLEGHPVVRRKSTNQVPEISTVQVDNREVELQYLTDFYLYRVSSL